MTFANFDGRAACLWTKFTSVACAWAQCHQLLFFSDLSVLAFCRTEASLVFLLFLPSASLPSYSGLLLLLYHHQFLGVLD